MRVKAATATDFPQLLEEWKTLFPDKNDGIESQQENSPMSFRNGFSNGQRV